MRNGRALFYWRITRTFNSKNLVGLTYANDRHMDGAGAQIQRIVGIYSLSRLLGLPYIHSPLIAIEKHGAAPDDFIAQCNEKFSIPSDFHLPDKYNVIEIDDPDLKMLKQIVKESNRRRTFSLVRITRPYNITEVYPHAYEAVKNISPFPFQKSSTVRVAIHVRRGDLLSIKEYSFRILPDRYYVRLAQRLCEIFEKNKLEATFELYSDGNPAGHGICQFEEFNSIPNLRKFVDLDPMEALWQMATANVLVLSHSSFSYLAALFNVKGVILYHPFWCVPLESWVINDDLKGFCEKRFERRLEAGLDHGGILNRG